MTGSACRSLRSCAKRCVSKVWGGLSPSRRGSGGGGRRDDGKRFGEVRAARNVSLKLALWGGRPWRSKLHIRAVARGGVRGGGHPDPGKDHPHLGCMFDYFWSRSLGVFHYFGATKVSQDGRQDGPRPGSSQDAPRRPQDDPKTSQDAPKTASRRSQGAIRPQDAPRRP